MINSLSEQLLIAALEASVHLCARCEGTINRRTLAK